MDNLIFIPGLYQLRCRRVEQARYQRTCEHATDVDPHVAHDAGVTATRLEKEVVQLSEQIFENVTTIEGIERMVRFLTASPHKSPDRTLAIRHLEDASMRLRRELSTEDPTGCGQNARATALSQ